MTLWKGFVSLILGAYFEKRMAWFPVDRLQMEVSAMTGEMAYTLGAGTFSHARAHDALICNQT
jgi:hypothetical protein